MISICHCTFNDWHSNLKETAKNSFTQNAHHVSFNTMFLDTRSCFSFWHATTCNNNNIPIAHCDKIYWMCKNWRQIDNNNNDRNIALNFDINLRRKSLKLNSTSHFSSLQYMLLFFSSWVQWIMCNITKCKVHISYNECGYIIITGRDARYRRRSSREAWSSAVAVSVALVSVTAAAARTAHVVSGAS